MNKAKQKDIQAYNEGAPYSGPLNISMKHVRRSGPSENELGYALPCCVQLVDYSMLCTMCYAFHTPCGDHHASNHRHNYIIMCVYIYIYTHTHIYIDMCMCVYIYIYIYMYIYIYVYTQVYAYTSLSLYVYICIHIYTHMYT